MKPTAVKHQLLANGYFPAELPPAFITGQFADFAVANAKLFSKSGPSKCERYTNKELKHARRVLKIPNPANYFQLCEHMASNWKQVLSKLEGSDFSTLRNYLEPTGRFVKIRWTDFEEKRLLIPSTYKYILKTDISKFYPTVYTHSIPWATEGKTVAKANKDKGKSSSFGDKLDKLIRNAQDQQTLGLPIGPDASRLIAEMIMVAIDNRIFESFADKGFAYDGYRVVDDYFLCFDSYGDAEQALSSIASSALEFELTINERKTEIIPVSEWVENIWKQELLSFKIPKKNQKPVLKSYINKAFSLANSYRASNVIKYAVKRSARWTILEDAWPIYEAFLLRSVMAYPSVFEEVASILAAYHAMEYPISLSAVERLCERMIYENLPQGNHSEVAWSLLLYRMFDMRVDSDLGLELNKLDNSICAILALDIRENGKLDFDTTLIEELIDRSDALESNMWLLSYENKLRAWIEAPEYENDALNAMIEAKVSFYDKTIEGKASIGSEDEDSWYE